MKVKSFNITVNW